MSVSSLKLLLRVYVRPRVLFFRSKKKQKIKKHIIFIRSEVINKSQMKIWILICKGRFKNFSRGGLKKDKGFSIIFWGDK